MNELLEERIEDWVMSKVDEWSNHYRQNYKTRHEEYYRIWRGQWAEVDKTRSSERSRIIAPATQQAVESSVAEIEEATFGRGKFFDIADDIRDKNKEDIEFLRKALHEDFANQGIRKSVGEVLLNAAVFGTGIAEVVLEEVKEFTPASSPVMDGQLQAVGVNISDRTVVRLKSILPQNFCIDPVATSIDDALGCAIDEFVSKHSVEILQEQGVYDKDVTLDITPSDMNLEPEPDLAVYPDNKVRLTRYYGLVPTELLRASKAVIPSGHTSAYIEAIVVVSNGGELLKAIANPYMMQDRPLVSFSWDTVPAKFWGRGVCEKGYNSQKALDAELRARIDALALTVHPMMAMDATRIPRGTKPEIRAGKILLTNGDPKDILNPFNFGNVNQITFAQAGALQTMVQQSTGAVDSTGVSGTVNGEATAAGISMSLGAIIKRHKRTLVNFQDSFMLPFVRKAAWRYMQFEPELYPVADYKFNATSSLGIMAREYEVTQLVQLLQTMKQDNPAYDVLIESVIDNMNLSNRETIVNTIKQANQPNPQKQQEQQAQLKAQLDFQKGQTSSLMANAQEALAKANKLGVETQLLPEELMVQKLKAASNNLEKGLNDDEEFKNRLGTIEEYLVKVTGDNDNDSLTNDTDNDGEIEDGNNSSSIQQGDDGDQRGVQETEFGG